LFVVAIELCCEFRCFLTSLVLAWFMMVHIYFVSHLIPVEMIMPANEPHIVISNEYSVSSFSLEV
jgi:hypothetical protein